MEVSYKRELCHSYLILQDRCAADYNVYPVHMIQHGKIAGLLPLSIHQVDNQNLFYYETTSKQPLTVLYETKKMGYEPLAVLIGALLKTVDEMQRYLLPDSSLLLNPEYIYLDGTKQEVGFCCWPFEKEERTQSFLSLMEYLLPKIDHDDQEAVTLGYQLYRSAMEGNICPEEVQRELYGKREDSVSKKDEEESLPGYEKQISADPECLKREQIRRQETLEELLRQGSETGNFGKSKKIWGILTAGAALLFYVYLMSNQFFSWEVGMLLGAVLLGISGFLYLVIQMRERKKEKNTKNRRDVMIVRESSEKESEEIFHQTVSEELPDIMEKAETVLMHRKEEQKLGMLKALTSSQAPDIILKSGVILLGKQKESVDVVLPFPTVSRIHARITCSVGEGCFVADLNSKNGTYVNGMEIVGYEGRILEDGDTVSFADVMYRYTNEERNLHIGREAHIITSVEKDVVTVSH